jgi:alpha-1,3-rhamnosyl/mannosyltransferase
MARGEGRAIPGLVLVGADRGERPVLEREIGRSGVRAHFRDRVDDLTLAQLYAGAAAFVYPSRYEGFGLPLLEAMAAGTPVVAARAASIPEVVGEAGILVDPDSEEEFAQALDRVLTDEELARRLREAGRRRAQSFSWERTAAGTLDAYRAVVGAAAQTAPATAR